MTSLVSPESLLPGATVLVTGGTGFTGRVLLRKLCAMDLKVRAIARATSAREGLEDLPVEWITGQVYDPAVVAAAMGGVQYIFHVAAAFRTPGIEDEEYRRVHVDSTRLLAQEAVKQPAFERFVHVSTVGVHGHIAQPPADETTPFHPGDIYQETKAEAESWLHAFAKAQALPYTVIRPAAIYGPGDRRLLKVFRMAAAPVFILLGRGKCLYHLIHVEDLTAAFIRAAWHPNALGEAFICGNPEATPLETMGRIIADELHHPFRPLRLPVTPFFWAAALTEGICRPLKLSPPLYRRRVAFFTKDRSFDTQKICRLLDFHVQWNTEEGLRSTTRWYRENGWL
ncbi:MAG: NAD-dependent epimerase/dehydratase family protein [Verrucomicrobiota bacterium]|jgi:nucleoside-diphosphate-sugar epimerase|nr:NAD-dependent epimerase/dehydratase family protein [Verrucomicrobiota bacterium]